jgi:DNA-binding winged helix-turn-helix (wHTH) protein
MDEGWHVAGMILTVQVAEKRKLAAHTTGQPPGQPDRCAILPSNVGTMAIAIPSGRVRFATFEVDLRSGELHKQGIKIKLHDQPFQVLAMLLEHPGELVTREQLHQRLWPSDTFVDFDVGLNSAIKRLRDALGDSAEEPRYIETLPRRGYRFIARIENGDLPASPVVEVHRAILPLQQRLNFGTSAALSLRLVSQPSSLLLPPSLRGASFSLGPRWPRPTSSSWRASSTRQVIPSSTTLWTKPSKSNLPSPPF